MRKSSSSFFSTRKKWTCRLSLIRHVINANRYNFRSINQIYLSIKYNKKNIITSFLFRYFFTRFLHMTSRSNQSTVKTKVFRIGLQTWRACTLVRGDEDPLMYEMIACVPQENTGTVSTCRILTKLLMLELLYSRNSGNGKCVELQSRFLFLFLFPDASARPRGTATLSNQLSNGTRGIITFHSDPVVCMFYEMHWKHFSTSSLREKFSRTLLFRFWRPDPDSKNSGIFF